MTHPAHRHTCQIIPEYMLRELARNGEGDVASRAQRTLERDQQLRAERNQAVQPVASGSRTPAPGAPAADDGTGPSRSIHDAHHTSTLPGTLVRAEGAKATADESVNEAYDGLGDTWELYHQAFERDSIDGKGLALVGTVHYEKDYDNAFWNGEQMVFGDGDGTIFGRFTASIDVIGHELTHGVTQYTAALVYEGQPGALNESISDVFGSMVKQHALGQTAEQADWLIGAGLLAPGIKGRALRDMLNPGTAYDDPQLGTDPQPADMAHYVDTSDDNGGVHTNSGIPNRAFALAARAIGGNSWEGAGLVWYDVLTGEKIQARCNFATFAQLTIDAATERFGAGSKEATAVADAWKTVGVEPKAAAAKKVAHKKPSATSAGTGRPVGPSTPVSVQRNGGVAGVTKHRETTLGELPEADQHHWASLLAGPELEGLAAEAVHPDAFSYRVRSEPCDLDVTLGENVLPQPVKALFRRTLDEGPNQV